MLPTQAAPTSFPSPRQFIVNINTVVFDRSHNAKSMSNESLFLHTLVW